MLSRKLSYGAAILAGLMVGFVGPTMLGYTSAIALPAGYLGWFGDRPEFGMAIWEWLVVRLPVYGLLGALAAWLVIKVGDAGWLVLCSLIIVSDLAVLLWIQPTLSGHNLPESLLTEWLAFHLAALIPAVLLIGFIESRRA